MSRVSFKWLGPAKYFVAFHQIYLMVGSDFVEDYLDSIGLLKIIPTDLLKEIEFDILVP